MKRTNQKERLGQSAFTLVEMLVVIAIIGILAALLLPTFGIIKDRSKRPKARNELAQIVTAIERYHAKYGHYPPDNPARPALNPLFYELLGTRLTNNVYETLDGRTNIPAASIAGVFGVGGFVNCTKAGGGDDSDAGKAVNFLPDLKPGRYGFMDNGGVGVGVLTSAVGWPANLGPVISPPPGVAKDLNPIRYNSSSPTHNPKSFDLWVDILVGGKTNRISNWNPAYEIVYQPGL